MSVGYQTAHMSPLELILDPTNPRFIAPLDTPTQDTIRRHLLDYEEVADLAQKIVDFGGLRPGERIVVTQERGQYVVLEGNRRICACQLLLNPSLVPRGYRVPRAYPSVLSAIRTVGVDIVESRDAAAPVLASRHIEGAKKWGTLAKMRFFVARLERGQSPEEIAEITETRPTTVRELARDYYLVARAMSLAVWTPEERAVFDHAHEMRVTRFTRMFHTEDIQGILQITYDPITQRPESGLGDVFFDKALELVARATLLSKQANTRKTISEVPGIRDLIVTIRASAVGEQGDEADPDMEPSGGSDERQPSKGSPGGSASPGQAPGPPLESGSPRNEQSELSANEPSPPLFFETLSCSGLRTDDQTASGVLTLAKEIKEISRDKNLAIFPVAAGMLMRALLEQSIKYYLKRDPERWKDVVKRYTDPSLGQLLEYCRKRKSHIFIPDVQRLFETVDCVYVKNSLDLNTHQTEIVTLTAESVKAIAKCGVRAFIQTLLS